MTSWPTLENGSEEEMNDWISVEDKLPPERTWCWTVERSNYKKNNPRITGTSLSHTYSGALIHGRTYCTITPTGKKRLNPWGIKGDKEVTHWIKIPIPIPRIHKKARAVRIAAASPPPSIVIGSSESEEEE